MMFSRSSSRATPVASLQDLNRRWNCRLTCTGRRSGEPRTVTIWFVLDDGRLYLTGGKDDPQWCRNVRANGDVQVRIGGRDLRGRARVVGDSEQARLIRERFVRKYWPARIGRWFGGYTRSIPVEVEFLDPPEPADG